MPQSINSSSSCRLRGPCARYLTSLVIGWTFTATPFAAPAFETESKPNESQPAATTPSKSATEAPSQATEIKGADIDLWIRNLDSDQYAERQAAMRNLRRSGKAGVAALLTVARGNNLEATTRAIELLTQLYESPDPDVAFAADEDLEDLGEKGPAVAVVRTQQVLLTTLAAVRRRHAIAAIKKMGGNIIPTSRLDDEGEKEIEADLNDEGTIQYIVLGKRWTGGLAGAKYLQRLPELRMLYITKDIALNANEQEQFKALLSGVRIEVRGSAYLGIKSNQAQPPEMCIVDNVVPNSPAARGGLLPGDEITHLDGLEVHGFAALTSMLSFKKGGELVYLEVRRGLEFVELEVTLGEW